MNPFIVWYHSRKQPHGMPPCVLRPVEEPNFVVLDETKPAGDRVRSFIEPIQDEL